MGIVDKVKQFINDLVASMQRTQLYSTEHLIFKKSVDKAYESLKEALKEREKLIIGIISDEFAFEKEIFFELSNLTLAKKAIIFFQERGIEKIVFYPYVSKDELNMFIAFLVNPSKEQIKMDLEQYLVSLGIKNITVGKVKAPDSISTKESEPINFPGIYENYLKVFSEYAQGLLDSKAADFSSLKIAVGDIMEHLFTHHQEILKLTAVRRPDISSSIHSANTSIFAMYFSFKAGFSKKDILDMGIAALFHDIGKIYIARRVEGFADIKSHTRQGAEALLKYVDALGVLPVIVSFEHHLKFNSGEYPGLPSGYTPHIASSIISICDVYDALSQRNSSKRNYPPDGIYKLMMEERGRAFDPDLLDIFFRIIGVWPIGTIVSLNDGTIAVVRMESEEDAFCPQVETIYPQDRRKLIDLRERKEELRIERALNPFTEGKDYLHQA